MRAAFGGGYVVHVGKHAFRVAVVMLHGKLHNYAVLRSAYVYGFGVKRGLVRIEIFYKVRKTALEAIFAFLFVPAGAFVRKRKANAAVKVGKLSEPL